MNGKSISLWVKTPNKNDNNLITESDLNRVIQTIKLFLLFISYLFLFEGLMENQ